MTTPNSPNQLIHEQFIKDTLRFLEEMGMTQDELDAERVRLESEQAMTPAERKFAAQLRMQEANEHQERTQLALDRETVSKLQPLIDAALAEGRSLDDALNEAAADETVSVRACLLSTTKDKNSRKGRKDTKALMYHDDTPWRSAMVDQYRAAIDNVAKSY